jgi:hypothetical protein
MLQLFDNGEGEGSKADTAFTGMVYEVRVEGKGWVSCYFESCLNHLICARMAKYIR